MFFSKTLLALALTFQAASAIPSSFNQLNENHHHRPSTTLTTIHTTTSTTTASIPTFTPPDLPICKPGALCDCSRIKDQNSDEFFQCVTNPQCEVCWHAIPTPEAALITPNPTTLATLTRTAEPLPTGA
ncbi:hypothetical protein PT974_11165 [Cladobotryum mycophilum]|uniref:Uncharacterized protein n=1 Tax=Cladobotryum mycophilum TaxID=491253 RepID=A0ABR0S4G3_9HYPO